jgi:UDP-glucose 6-dehydrogenase
MMEDVKNPEVDTDANFVSSILHVQKETTQDEIDELLKPLPMPSILEILQQEVKPNSEELTEADIQKLIDSLKQ